MFGLGKKELNIRTKPRIILFEQLSRIDSTLGTVIFCMMEMASFKQVEAILLGNPSGIKWMRYDSLSTVIYRIN